MKILINALSAKQGGGQTYIRNLLRNFPDSIEREIVLLAPKSLEMPSGRSNIRRFEISPWLVENPYARTVWEYFFLPKLLRKLRTDILFCPGGSVTARAPSHCKVVTTFQNMIPFDYVQRRRYPLGPMRLRNWMLEKILLKSMLRSDLVIFISEFAKTFISERVKGEHIQGVVISHGISPEFRKPTGQLPSPPDWLPKDGYLLYVSTLDVYKAQIEVVEAYSILKRNCRLREKLVLIGPEYAPYAKKVRDTIAAHDLTRDVIIVGVLPHRDLAPIYQGATVNIFASETENCPFILLEALSAGRPLLVSSRPPMPEFGGDAVVYFDPASPVELAAKLRAVLDSSVYMKQLSMKAFERSLAYEWDKTAEKTWKSFDDLVANLRPT